MKILRCSLCLVGVLLFLTGSVFSAEKKFSPEIERINEYFLTSHILLKDEQADFITRINQASGTVKEEDLRHLALATVEKVVRDRSHLEFIVRDLQKLSQDEYSSKIGKITAKDLDTAFETLKSFRTDMRLARPAFNSKKKLAKKDYQNILNNHSSLLSETDGRVTSSVVWESVKQAIGPAYSSWDAQYQTLMSKVKEAQDNGENPESRLTKDETKFVKVFARVQSYWFILDGTGR